MIKLFTPSLYEIQTTKAAESLPDQSEVRLTLPPDRPSSACIRNILNFSKNLEVRTSETLGTIHYLRS